MPEEKKTKFCSNCGSEIDMKAKICPKCGVEQPLIPEKVSNWWYILAIFLGIVGGIIAWAVNKDHNPKKAISFLIVGLVLPAGIAIVGILSSIVLVSLGGARERAKDARIIADMGQLRSSAEIYFYQEDMDSYADLCTDSDIVALQTDIIGQGGTGYNCQVATNGLSYCVGAKLNSGKWWCVDSDLRSQQYDTSPSCDANQTTKSCQ